MALPPVFSRSAAAAKEKTQGELKDARREWNAADYLFTKEKTTPNTRCRGRCTVGGHKEKRLFTYVQQPSLF